MNLMARPDLLIISSEFPPKKNPEADHTKKLCLELSKRGISVEAVVSSKISSSEKHKYNFVINDIMKKWNWFECFKLTSLIFRRRPRAILIIYVYHMYNRNIMITALPFLIKTVLKGCRVVTQFEYFSGAIFSRVYPAIARRIVSKIYNFIWQNGLFCSDHLIFLSEISQLEAGSVNKMIFKKSLVLPVAPFFTPPSLEELQEYKSKRGAKLNIDSGTKVILYYGYLYYGKGIEYLIEAVKLLRQENYKIKVLLLGGAIEYNALLNRALNYIFELKEMIKNYGLQDLFIWQGIKAGEEASEYIACADMAVFPFESGLRANNSSFATVICHGVPVIVTKNEVIPDNFFINSDYVLFCKQRDPLDLVKKLKFLLDNEEERAILARRSLEFSRLAFNWDDIVSKILEVLQLNTKRP